MSTPVFVIAQQQSGTNLLRRSLASTDLFQDSNEIFHPEKQFYWSSWAQQISEQPDQVLPTAENKLQIFENFLNQHLVGDKRFALIDVKYDSTHILDGIWHSPIALPEFVQWLIHKKHPVVHLVRKNCLETYVSFVTGSAAADGRRLNASTCRTPVRLRLDVDETVSQIQRREREIRRFQSHLAQTNHIELDYASLSDADGNISTSVAAKISMLLGLDELPTIKFPSSQIGCPVHEVVENFESELLPAFVNNGMEQYVSPGVSQGTQKTPDSTASSPSEQRSMAMEPRPSLWGVPRIRRNETKSKPVFVVAMQRSGTNLFRKSLSTSGYFHDLNEIFDPYHKLYWPYRAEAIRQNSKLAIPTSRNQLEIFESFLDHCLTSEKPFSLVDVKYNSTQNLNKVWHHPGSRPLLIDWLIEQKCPVIHLVRENVLENYVSNVMAFQSRVWLVEKAGHVSDQLIRLDVETTLRTIETIKTQIEVFRTWLQPTNHIELRYESLIDQQGEIAAEPIRRTCDLVGIDEELNISIPTKKTGRLLREMVENFESEIAPALIENGYGEWLKQKAA